MCLIIHKPAGRKVPKDVLESGLDFNRDGFGLMYADQGKLIVEKSLDPKWLKRRLPKLRSREVVIHLRMRTHGKISLDFAHPFTVTNDIAMVHNGILCDYGDEQVSDTADFNSGVLQPLLTKHPAVFNDPPFASVLEEYIGDSNKILMMRSDGVVWSLNRHLGIEYNGVWLSNTYAWEAAGKRSYYFPTWEVSNVYSTVKCTCDWEDGCDQVCRCGCQACAEWTQQNYWDDELLDDGRTYGKCT